MSSALRPSAHPRGRLSRSEARVLAFSAGGYTKAETARFLRVSPETVKSQRDSVLRKLGARNTAHAVAIAATSGMLGAATLARVVTLAEVAK